MLAVVALGWFVVTNLTGGDDGGQVKQGDATAASSEAPSSTEAVADDATARRPRRRQRRRRSEATATTEATTTPTTADGGDRGPDDGAADGRADHRGRRRPPPAPTNPDGTPACVTAIYDVDQHHAERRRCPTPTSKAKLEYARPGQRQARPGRRRSINNLTINPAVPRDVGVRVVELTSERFPDGSATVSLEQAAELNRVVNVMNLLPNITALVIGHADQRGDRGLELRAVRSSGPTPSWTYMVVAGHRPGPACRPERSARTTC